MTVITLENVSKIYRQYPHPWDRLKEAVTQRSHHHAHEVLKTLSLNIGKGHVVGLVGANGAGKSTLLKLIAGTLQPTTGSVKVKGHIAALLELGAGFHPEMTGRENVFLGGAVAGLNHEDIRNRYDEIVNFSGLHEAMNRPVKTYSSGMSARLAFAVAMAIEPEILILDETLSVGDGAFARRSFDRIIDFKHAGKTILFCSHSMYQVESICDRVLWLDKGKLMLDGNPAEVVTAYSEFLSSQVEPPTETGPNPQRTQTATSIRILEIRTSIDGYKTKNHIAHSRKSDLVIDVRFKADPNMPIPTLGLTLTAGNGWAIASASCLEDGLKLVSNANNEYSVRVTFPRLPLLKGRYWINVFLLCEKGIHVYDSAERAAEINVIQQGREAGVVSLPRYWESIAS